MHAPIDRYNMNILKSAKKYKVTTSQEKVCEEDQSQCISGNF